MKRLSLFAGLLLFLSEAHSQTYINLDSARKLVQSSAPEKKFRGMRTLDRFYYSTGLFDSSELFKNKCLPWQKKQKAIP
jgi:hypothetical protein